jgi:hypothetical protein
MEDNTPTKFDREPSYGFCAGRGTSNIQLAEALERVRRQVCAYNWPPYDSDARCDCKFGATVKEKFSFGSESTGCPELREIIYSLLHRPEALSD